VLGATPLATFLPSLRRDGQAHAATPPRRIIFFTGSHGSLLDNHWPVAAAGKPATTEREFRLCSAHQALNPWISKLIYTEGLSMVSAQRDTGKDDPHLVGRGHMLTGMPLVDKGLANAGGISIDQHIAKALNSPKPVTRFASLEVASRSRKATLPVGISFAGARQNLPVDWDPAKTFKRIFPEMTGGMTGQSPAFDKSVLDFVMGEYTAVKATLPNKDREKLEAHMALVRDLETRLSVTGAMEAAACAPAKIDDLALTSTDGVALWQANTEAMSRLLVTALACDLTRVASFNLHDSGDGGDTDLLFGTYKHGDHGTASFHDLVHKMAMSGSPQSKSAAAHAAVSGAHVLHAKKLARLLELLAAIPEGDGTLLDHTVVAWVTEIGQGNHNYDRLPWVLAGSCGGHFATGRYVKFANGTPHNNFLCSLARAMEVPTATFGDPGLSKTSLDAQLRGT
jgi:hypothetical protein